MELQPKPTHIDAKHLEFKDSHKPVKLTAILGSIFMMLLIVLLLSLPYIMDVVIGKPILKDEGDYTYTINN